MRKTSALICFTLIACMLFSSCIKVNVGGSKQTKLQKQQQQHERNQQWQEQRQQQSQEQQMLRSAKGLKRAVIAISAGLTERLDDGITLAATNILSDNLRLSEQAMDELEYQLVSVGKFTVVDRKRLNEIRAEQVLQTSGDVDDATIVQLGYLSGASVVITGSITVLANSRHRLNIRALDVKTGTIIFIERKDF